MNGLSSKVVEKKACAVMLELALTKDIIDENRTKALEKIQKQATVSGFRKGKAPMDVIQSQYKANAEQEMLQMIVPAAISETIHKEKLQALFYPEVTNLDIKEDGSLKFNINVEIAPKFDVKNYKGIKLPKTNTEVTDKDIDAYIDQLKERAASMEIDETGVVGKDSFVAIDYTGTIDGEAFEGGSEKDRLLSIQNSGFIEGFAEGLIGLKVNDEKDLNLKFPKDYHAKEYAGKDVIFNVKINEIKKKKIPEVTEEFVKGFGAESIDDFKTKIKDSLIQEKQNQAKRETEDAIIDALIKKNDIDVPKTMVENEAKRLAERMQQQYAQYGMKDFDITPLKDKFNEDAKKQVKAYYILSAILEKEGLKATDEDFNKKQEEMIAQNPDNDKQVKEYFKDDKNKSNIMSEIIHEKLFKFLIKNAKK